MSLRVNPLAPRRPPPEKVRQIKAWTRETHGLDEDVVVSVSELACHEDDCPDIETVVGIMRPGKTIETIRIGKCVDDVCEGDLACTAAGPANLSVKET